MVNGKLDCLRNDSNSGFLKVKKDSRSSFGQLVNLAAGLFQILVTLSVSEKKN